MTSAILSFGKGMHEPHCFQLHTHAAHEHIKAQSQMVALFSDIDISDATENVPPFMINLSLSHELKKMVYFLGTFSFCSRCRYFAARAKGGVGLMVTGGISPNRAGGYFVELGLSVGTALFSAPVAHAE
jgi:hypothetical protein